MKNIIDEGIKDREKYNENVPFVSEYLDDAIKHVLRKIDENLEKFTYKFPFYGSENLVYPLANNTFWTSGFWTGMLWLAYDITSDEKYRKVAEIQLKSYKERIELDEKNDTCDIGFLYSLSCVAAYKITGNEEAKEIALKAAERLTKEYVENSGVLITWSDPNCPKGYRFVVGCIMNLPLLLWAWEVSGNTKYYEIAYSHLCQTINYIIREDSSTFHWFYKNIFTGEPIGGETHQKYVNESCWARGQAWAVYGLNLNYNYLGDPNLLAISKKTINYFLNRLPEDLICHWDLIFTNGEEEKDSSAAAIAVCGMLELSKHLPLSDEDKRIYENASLGILKSLIDNYTTKDYAETNGVLLHGVIDKPTSFGIDESTIFGDYFYFEALVRIKKDWKLFW